MKERWPVQWHFQKEDSPTDNLESLALSLDMLARLLWSFGNVGVESNGDEMTIHPYTFLLLEEVVQSMANETHKMIDGLMDIRRKRKGNPGPNKLVPFDRSNLKAEDEAKEESDGEESKA